MPNMSRVRPATTNFTTLPANPIDGASDRSRIINEPCLAQQPITDQRLMPLDPGHLERVNPVTSERVKAEYDDAALIQPWESDLSVFLKLKAIKKSGLHNFQGCQIPLNHELNIQAWKYYLDGTDYEILPSFLNYGFPMSFSDPDRLKSPPSNYPTALAYPKQLAEYLLTEKAHGAMAGPFKPSDHPHIHSNPLMSRPKKNSAKRRFILDLSAPPGAGVNSLIKEGEYLGVPCKITLPTPQTLADWLVELPRGSYLFACDLERGYKQLRADPGSYELLGITFLDQLWIELSISFGARYSQVAMVFTTEALAFILYHYYSVPIIPYSDDLVGVANTEAQARQNYNIVLFVCNQLGLKLAPNKLSPPAPTVVWLGLEFSAPERTMTVPHDKISDTLVLVNLWLDKTTATISQLRRLLGKLLYVSHCNRVLRIFLNRILQVLRETQSKKVTVSPDMKADLYWISHHLPLYSGKLLLEPPINASHELIVDSSLQGAGATFGIYAYAKALPQFITDMNLPINALELLNCVVAIKVFAPLFKGTSLRMLCDNEAAVSILSTGRTRRPFLAKCAREVWSLQFKFNFSLNVEHIATQDNIVADQCSRYFQSASAKLYVDNLIQSGCMIMCTPDDYLFKLCAQY